MRFSLLSLFLYRLMFTMFYKPRVDMVAPVEADTLSDMAATALQLKAWNKTLRERCTLDDVYNRLKVAIDPVKQNTIPDNAIFMQFEAAPTGAHSYTFGMSVPLQNAPQEGTAETVLGNEEQLDLLSLTIYYNEIKKGVALKGWGIDFEDLSQTGVYGQVNAKFVKYFQELRGRRIREAQMLTYSSELTKAPVSKKQQFNPNIFICNLAAGSQPEWDGSNLSTTAGSADSKGFYSTRTHTGDYVEAIADAMVAASGTGTTSKAYLDVGNIIEAEYYVTQILKMESLADGTYIWVLPSAVAASLKDPTLTGSVGNVLMQAGDLTDGQRNIPNVLGRYGRFVFVEDSRAATLTIGGSNGSWTLKPGFVQPGGNDDRNMSPWTGSSGGANYVFEAGCILGAGGLAEWVVKDIQYAKETTEYLQNQGKAGFFLGGIQLALFDKDTPDTTAVSPAARTIVNQGSCLTLFSRRAISTLK